MDLQPSIGFALRSLLPPLVGLEPLPRLTVCPDRLTTPPLTLERDYAEREDEVVATLFAKVRAEDERMRRILPALPDGLHWEADLQMMEPDYNFTMGRVDVIVRLVYRVKGLDYDVVP